MKRFGLFTTITLCVALLISLLPVTAITTYAQSGGETIYLPIISGGTGVNYELSDLLKQAINLVLVNNGSPLSVREVGFNGYSLTIHLIAPLDEQLLDNAAFENMMNEMDVSAHNVLVAAGFPEPINYDYEMFINDQPFTQGYVPDSEVLTFTPGDENLMGDLPGIDAEGEEILQPTGAEGKKIVLSPGHGWAVRGDGWALDRGYHWGIVEDFINHELVRILAPKLTSSGVSVIWAREPNLSAGNHYSGYPWWEMGSSEYVRNLGAPGQVWGNYISIWKGYDRNVVAPPRYAKMVGADMLISIHNNGSMGCGTETLYDTSNGKQEESRRLASLIQNKLIERLRSQWNANWCNRGIKGFAGNYGENRLFGGEGGGPSVIVELAFMDTQSDNDALKNSQFREIAMTAIHDAVLEYYGGGSGPAPQVPPVVTFSGSPSSRLFLDQNNTRLNLEVCANNLPGQTVQVRLSRPGKLFEIVKTTASERCATFWGINGSETLLSNTPYTTRAALNQPPNDNWAVPCYSATGGRGLCDTVTTSSLTTPSSTFINGSSSLTIDSNAVNLQVCGDNLAGKVVYAQMWRSAAQGYPANTWNYSKYASGNCITFSDMDGAGGTFANVDYYTVAALEPISSGEAAQQRTVCYAVTGSKRLCDRVNRITTSNVFINGSSTPTITTSAINLQVCASNLAGRTVYAQMWRAAALGYPAHTWNYSLAATGSCVTFSDMDGAGNTFAGVAYYTVAALEPIGSGEAAERRTSCYATTENKRLCDRVSR